MTVRCCECGVILGVVQILYEECYEECVFVDTKHECSKPIDDRNIYEVVKESMDTQKAIKEALA
jgi:hypothetical protein